MVMATAGSTAVARVAASTLPDLEVVRRVRGGESALFEILMRRHNQRMYRVARSVVKDEDEVEDVMQQAYISAFTHLHQFEERAQFSTWMTRITLNEAFARRRSMQRSASMAAGPRPESGQDHGAYMDTIRSSQPDPERQAFAGELQKVLEEAVDALPETYRTVFVLRDVEGLSTAETGDGLGLGEEAVKTRLHRARAMIRRSVTARLGAVAVGAFEFRAPRCDRVVAKVLAAILDPPERADRFLSWPHQG
jgi:RNA polymerase sigma-70 factor, ECF subfamily